MSAANITLRTALIDAYIADLITAFGGVKPHVPSTPLKRFFEQKRYGEMIGFVMASLGLDIRLRIALVHRKWAEHALATIFIPKNPPLYGTPQLQSTLFTLRIYQPDLVSFPFASVVMIMAHELTHAVMDTTRHPLRKCEEAVDLAAMVLGYAEQYRCGCTFTRKPLGQEINVPFGKQLGLRPEMTRLQKSKTYLDKITLGYLSFEEVQYAASVLDRCRPA